MTVKASSSLQVVNSAWLLLGLSIVYHPSECNCTFTGVCIPFVARSSIQLASLSISDSFVEQAKATTSVCAKGELLVCESVFGKLNEPGF